MERTKEMLTFLDHEDEATLWEQLVADRPDLLLVDGSRWPTPDPPIAAAPASCQSTTVFLWSPLVRRVLPSRQRGLAHDGPRSGVVIEWSRCRAEARELRSGRFAVGYDTDDLAMKALVDVVFARVKTSTDNRLTRLGGEPERTYRVGAHARRSAGNGVLLRDRSVEIHYSVD